jgi:hypothetical protein
MGWRSRLGREIVVLELWAPRAANFGIAHDARPAVSPIRDHLSRFQFGSDEQFQWVIDAGEMEGLALCLKPTLLEYSEPLVPAE